LSQKHLLRTQEEMKIAVKAINHFGDEGLKVFKVL
jgi:hypothetical protein